MLLIQNDYEGTVPYLWYYTILHCSILDDKTLGMYFSLPSLRAIHLTHQLLQLALE